jgi:hypothetical protein
LLQDGPPLFLNSIVWRGVTSTAASVGWPYINDKMTIMWLMDQVPSKYAVNAKT